MAGNKAGAAKARQKNLEADPDFYKKIGALSWKDPSRSHETGFALVSEDLRKELGAKGGRRTKKDYKKNRVLEAAKYAVKDIGQILQENNPTFTETSKDRTGVSE